MSFEISMTAIRAQTARMEVTAHNIANVDTPGFAFYRALLAAEHGAMGGTRVASVEQPRPAEAPDAPADVEMGAELVELITAQRAFEANVRMIEVQNKTQDFLLNRLRAP